MKRKGTAFFILLCMLLMLGSITVSAASATVRLTSSVASARHGESITVTVNLTGADEAKSALIAPIYDEAVLEITGGEWLVSGTMSAYDASKKVGLYADTAVGKLHGDVFAMTFRVKENAKSGETEVSCSVTMKNGTVTLPVAEIMPTTVSVVCSHSFSPWRTDGTKHKRACTICGETETAYHTWNDGVVNQKPTETSKGLMTYTCIACGETERRETPELSHVHSFDTAWKWDEDFHWHACSCGEKKDISPHAFGEWMVIKEPTTTSKGEKVRICSCGAVEVEQIDKLPTSTTGSTKPVETTASQVETSTKAETTASTVETTSKTETTVEPTETTQSIESSLRIETDKNPPSADGGNGVLFIILAVMGTIVLIGTGAVVFNINKKKQ